MCAIGKLIKKRTQSVRRKSIVIHINGNIYLVWCLIHIYRHASAKICFKEKLHSVEKKLLRTTSSALNFIMYANVLNSLRDYARST